jgi:hypothetical protein
LIRRGAAAWAALAVALMTSPAPRAALAAVQVIVGATPIVNGAARAAGDITVMNEKLAFALAVDSSVPYGVPRGALIDLAPVTAAGVGQDRVVFADFIPDHWSAWPNTYQHVDILEHGPERAVIRSERDWGKVTIVTVYTLRANADHIEIVTTMRNGGEVPLTGLLSGLTLWPNSGFLFSVPGMQGVAEARVDQPLADRVVAYDQDWAIALHAPYVDHVGDGSMDMYLKHDLGVGQSREFSGWLQVLPSGDLAPVVAAEIEQRHLASGDVHGMVRGVDGAPIDQPVVMVERNGKTYAWVLGHAGRYDVRLPAGKYTLYATARNHSESRRSAVEVTADSIHTQNFAGLRPPGRVAFTVTAAGSHAPLDARIVIAEGQKPVVEFLGRRTFFTALETQGRVELPIAPGKYVFAVSSGGGFLGSGRRIDVMVAPHATTMVPVALERTFAPAARGWYSADLHHHADQAEGVTPAAYLAASELAAGLDVLFVSDHDSIANHAILQAIADRRHMAFIPSVEFSPSWGHFNAYPLVAGRNFDIDTSVATVDEIFHAARRMGAPVIQANHPFIPYGYLHSVAAGTAPGGFNPAFELLEINDSAPEDDDKVLHALWRFWNAGDRYYLSAGTDTHDVWNSESGKVRAFVHVDGKLTAASFADNLRAGHGYVSRGPLLYPGTPFGEELKVKPGESFALNFDLESVAGLKSVELIGAGAVLEARSFGSGVHESHVEFDIGSPAARWYSLVVTDDAGAKAYSDPIWIEAVAAPGG